MGRHIVDTDGVKIPVRDKVITTVEFLCPDDNSVLYEETEGLDLWLTCQKCDFNTIVSSMCCNGYGIKED